MLSSSAIHLSAGIELSLITVCLQQLQLYTYLHIYCRLDDWVTWAVHYMAAGLPAQNIWWASNSGQRNVETNMVCLGNS